MADWNRLTLRSPAELREQADAYRRAAETARMINVREALFKLADQFDGLADQREQLWGGPVRDEWFSSFG
jgi:hypothetical protein